MKLPFKSNLSGRMFGAIEFLGFYKKEFGILMTFILWQPLGVKG